MKKIIKSFFDYEILGEYYDRVPQKNGTITRVKKHIRKWYFVPLRKWREKRAKEKGGRK